MGVRTLQRWAEEILIVPARLRKFALMLRIARDTRGQDLIEYALLLGLLATAGAAFLPGIHDSIRTIFAAVGRALTGQRHHED